MTDRHGLVVGIAIVVSCAVALGTRLLAGSARPIVTGMTTGRRAFLDFAWLGIFGDLAPSEARGRSQDIRLLTS